MRAHSPGRPAIGSAGRWWSSIGAHRFRDGERPGDGIGEYQRVNGLIYAAMVPATDAAPGNVLSALRAARGSVDRRRSRSSANANGGDELSLHCKEVMAQEQKADDITRDVMVGVRRASLRPLIAGHQKLDYKAMDDAIDQMQQTAKAIVLFEMTNFGHECRPWPTLSSSAPNSCGGRCPCFPTSDQCSRLNEICAQISGSRATPMKSMIAG